MPSPRWVWDDGGRMLSGYTGKAGDCVVRAVAIATCRRYQQVYDELTVWIRADARKLLTEAAVKRESPRRGTPPSVIKAYLAALGWGWHPTMRIGQGTTVHLLREELPDGRLLVRCSRHLVAVIDGTIRDTHDPSRSGTRCVYGYWTEPGR